LVVYIIVSVKRGQTNIDVHVYETVIGRVSERPLLWTLIHIDVVNELAVRK